MSANLEGPNVSFKKSTGKETAVNIITETLLTEGNLGEIFDALIEINGRKKRFIIKRYFGDKSVTDGEASAKKFAKKAFENYSLVKEAGLKVFPTFRMGEDKKSILMTTGFRDDQICLGSNSTLTVENFGQSYIKEIVNLDEFLANIFREGLKATQKGVSIDWDALFFVFNKDGPTKIDFIFGDFDLIEETKSTKEVGRNNMENIRTALNYSFINNNIALDFQKKFYEKVEYYYKQGIDSVNSDSALR